MNQSLIVKAVDQVAIAAAARPARRRLKRSPSSACASSGERLDDVARIVAIGAAVRDLLGGQAEDDDVVVADALLYLDIGAVERADGQRAVERELHVAGARGLHAGGRDLLATGRPPA